MTNCDALLTEIRDTLDLIQNDAEPMILYKVLGAKIRLMDDALTSGARLPEDWTPPTLPRGMDSPHHDVGNPNIVRDLEVANSELITTLEADKRYIDALRRERDTLRWVITTLAKGKGTP